MQMKSSGGSPNATTIEVAALHPTRPRRPNWPHRGCRSHRTTGSNLGRAAPNSDPKADRLAVLRHELAGGEGRASRIGKDGESHPRRILRLGEDRASEFARSRSDRVHVVDVE